MKAHRFRAKTRGKLRSALYRKFVIGDNEILLFAKAKSSKNFSKDLHLFFRFVAKATTIEVMAVWLLYL